MVAVPSPTDAAAEGDTSSIESRLAAVEHVVGLAKEQAPYGLLGPNINPLHLANRVEDLERDVKSILAQLKAMGMVQEDDSKAIADLERWREGVDQKLADLDKIEYDWTSLRDAYDNRVKDYVDIKDQHDRMAWKVIRIEQRLDALRGTDSKSPNPESTAWKDGWHAGHEAGYRSGQESVPLRGPEVTVTDEMVQAYWLTAHTESLNTNSSMAMLIRAGLEAVFALRAGGAGQ